MTKEQKTKIITRVRTFLTLLLAVFITLKVTGAVAWSWWWILAPFWIPFTLSIFTVLLVGLGTLLERGDNE